MQSHAIFVPCVMYITRHSIEFFGSQPDFVRFAAFPRRPFVTRFSPIFPVAIDDTKC